MSSCWNLQAPYHARGTATFQNVSGDSVDDGSPALGEKRKRMDQIQQPCTVQLQSGLGFKPSAQPRPLLQLGEDLYGVRQTIAITRYVGIQYMKRFGIPNNDTDLSSNKATAKFATKDGARALLVGGEARAAIAFNHYHQSKQAKAEPTVILGLVEQLLMQCVLRHLVARAGSPTFMFTLMLRLTTGAPVKESACKGLMLPFLKRVYGQRLSENALRSMRELLQLMSMRRPSLFMVQFFLFLTSDELAIAQRFAESFILKFACVLVVIKNCLNDTALRRCKRNSWTPEAQVFNEQLWAMWPKTVKFRYHAFTPI